jgi:hypothetical protein
MLGKRMRTRYDVASVVEDGEASMRTLSPLMALALLSACSGAPERASNDAAVPPVAANAANASEAPGPPAGNTAISFTDESIEFRYSWPAVAAAIPELDAWLRGNGERLEKETRDGAARDRALASKDGYPFRGYGYTEDWRIAADIPALLVLQSDGYSFTGGAHGMPIVTVLFWDKATKQRLATSALFDLQLLTATLKERFCTALDAERSKRRGAPVNARDPDQLAEFVQCVDPAKQTILPVSRGGKALDTVRFVIMPYEAGPYSEGIYEIDLPVDATILQTVKPAYKAAFSAGKAAS